MEQEFYCPESNREILSFSEFLQRKYKSSTRQSYNQRNSMDEMEYSSYHQDNDSISYLRNELAKATNIVQRIRSPNNESMNTSYKDTQKQDYFSMDYVSRLKKELIDSIEETKNATKESKNLEIENLKLKRSFEEIKANFEKEKSKPSIQIELLEAKLKKKESDVDELISALNHNVKINKTLEANCGNYEKIIAKMKESMELLSKQNTLSQEQHMKELQEKSQSVKSIVSNNPDILAENEKLKDVLKEKNKMLSDIAKEMSAKEQIFSEITKMKDEIEDYSGKLEEMEKEISKRDEIIEKLKKLLDAKMPGSSPDQYQKKYEEEVEKNKLLFKKLEDIKPFVEELISSKDKMKDAFEKSIKEMNGQQANEALVKENKELKGINDLLISKMDGLPELENKFKELFDEIIKLRTENTVLKGQLGQLNSPEDDAEEVEGAEEGEYEEDNIDEPVIKEKKDQTINQSELNTQFIPQPQSDSKQQVKQEESQLVSSGLNLYSIYDSSIICYNLSIGKYTKVNAQGMKSFLASYQTNGSSYHNTLQGLFILTGKQFNELFYYSQKTQEINKIITFKENHQNGAMLLNEESKKVIIISGNHTNTIECLQIDIRKICSLPSLSQKRTKSSFCFINKILYMFFGFCPDTNKCLSTIEYLDINSTNKDNKWELLELKSKCECDISSHSVLNANDQEILILGGAYGNSSPHPFMIYFNFQQKSLEKIKKPLPDQFLKETHLFNKNSTFKDYFSGESLGFANIDDLNNIHLIDSSLKYQLVKFDPSTLG